MDDESTTKSLHNDLTGRIIAAIEARWLRSRISEPSVLLLLGVLVGLAAGGGAVIFRWLIALATRAFFDFGAIALSFMGSYYTVAVPALGGVIVGLLIHFGAREAKGHGVPEVMEAVVRSGGRIRPRVAVIKSLASSICIGSGGSVGREGPIAQIGAAIGSTLGQHLRLSDNRIRTLVACGAAGGIAATFNAPIAGAFFALEIILAQWTAEAFAPVVAASVAASVMGRLAFGDVPSFALPENTTATFAELPLFALLGLMAALVGILFIVLVYWAEDRFESIPIPPYLLPISGGLIVGVIGLYHRELYGVGYELIESILQGVQSNITILLVLLGLKLLATSATLGSGGSGGIFSPSLFLGAALGGAMALVFQRAFPGLISSEGAYAMVGMAAVFAATSHAPICVVMFGFELTRDYRMILPLMLACGISIVVAKGLYRFSIYNLKLYRRGVHVQLGQDASLLNEITIAEAMTTEIISVKPHTPVREVAKLCDTTKHHGFPVVDDEGRLHGCITIGDVQQAGPAGLDKQIHEVATHDLVIAFPDESINDGLRKLGLRDVGRIPVVAREDHSRLLGLLTRKNVIAAYKQALMRQHTRLEETQTEEHFD